MGETEENIIDPQKVLKLRTRLAASKKLGPSPNCISSASSPSAPMHSSPDRSYLYEEEEVKRKVTVSVIKRSDSGSMTSTGLYKVRLMHHLHQRLHNRAHIKVFLLRVAHH